LCYSVELDEHYCDVSVIRWVRHMKNAEKEFVVTKNGVDITGEEWINV
jgi:hypothetical protein